MIVTTRDTLCFLCGKIDDQQEEVVPGSLSVPPVTGHSRCVERNPELVVRKRLETKALDLARSDEYMKAMGAFWKEMEARSK